MNETQNQKVTSRSKKACKGNIECWDWSDVLVEDDTSKDEIKEMAKGVLGSPSPKLSCHLEITITHPHTTSWSNKMSLEQKKILSGMWYDIRCVGGMQNIKDSGYVYEFHKSGHVHLHGYIVFEYSNVISPYGLVSDYAKAVLKLMPKRYGNYNSNYMYDEWIRYKSPQVCVQYVNWIEKPQRFVEWRNYLVKTGVQIVNK